MRRGPLAWISAHLPGMTLVQLGSLILGTLASVIGILSPVLAPTTLRPYIAIGGAAGFVLLISYIFVIRAGERSKARQDQTLIKKYTEEIQKRVSSFWTLQSLKKVTTLDADGNAVSVHTIHATAVGEPLSFFRLHDGPDWTQPLQARKAVQVTARSCSDGVVGGVPNDVTTVWLDTGLLEIVVHFPHSVPANTEFCVVVRIDWPAKCRPLMREHRPENFYFVPASETNVQYVVILPDDADVYYEPIGKFDPRTSDPTRSLNLRRNSGGRVEVDYDALLVGAREKVGVRMSLR